VITETVIGIFIDVAVWIVGQVLHFGQTPPPGMQFLIPSPLLFAATTLITSSTAVLPVGAIWFIWRQVWGK
jgi:hypothetical protein